MPRSNAQQADQTRAALVATGRRLFARHGYQATSTEDVVRGAGATRGALYYHFRDKKALFSAVFEDVEADLHRGIVAASRGPGDALHAVERGLTAFLRACLDREVQQIVLLDGLSALGWTAWLELENRYGLGALQAGLEVAIEQGAAPDGDAEMTAHLLLGAVMQAGVAIAQADDPDRARERAVGQLGVLVAGVRAGRPT